MADDVRYIWPTRMSSAKLIYLYNRYANLGVVALTVAQALGVFRADDPNVGTRQFCFRSQLILTAFQFLSYACVHVLVLLRAWATWGRHPQLLWALGMLFGLYSMICLGILAWGFVVTSERGSVDAYPFAGIVGTCIGSIPPLAWLLWVPGLVLECTVFVLTLVSLRHFDRNLVFASDGGRIVWIIARDGALYFTTTIFSSIFNIILWTMYADRLLNQLVATFTLTLMIVAGQRLVLDLRHVNRGRSFTTTRLGREVDRALEAAARDPRTSSIRFAVPDSERASPVTPPSGAGALMTPPDTSRSHGGSCGAHGGEADEDEDVDGEWEPVRTEVELNTLGPGGRRAGSAEPAAV
ncbi:uncharacterized protein BXZ73DRAFT_102674 [Epithele typhae]|uniref:uncharacterized protein n=1 Tax=Epithele typhae TaxID=378194 RepID=UPI002008A7CD|nr:uncharacterized protein BXZ73DRAFT_102674 [Epithele typhae]KAH9927078.1 hypothetical protein BXZ73DRAFT_102674 [Epithele typhae]